MEVLIAPLIASGRLIDLLLVAVAIQGGAMAVHARRTGRGVPPASLLATLAAGGFLLLALRVALVGGWWGWIMGLLAASLAAHLLDLRLRWR